jgi:hypothetical protein
MVTYNKHEIKLQPEDMIKEVYSNKHNISEDLNLKIKIKKTQKEFDKSDRVVE